MSQIFRPTQEPRERDVPEPAPNPALLPTTEPTTTTPQEEGTPLLDAAAAEVDSAEQEQASPAPENIDLRRADWDYGEWKAWLVSFLPFVRSVLAREQDLSADSPALFDTFKRALSACMQRLSSLSLMGRSHWGSELERNTDALLARLEVLDHPDRPRQDALEVLGMTPEEVEAMGAGGQAQALRGIREEALARHGSPEEAQGYPVPNEHRGTPLHRARRKVLENSAMQPEFVARDEQWRQQLIDRLALDPRTRKVSQDWPAMELEDQRSFLQDVVYEQCGVRGSEGGPEIEIGAQQLGYEAGSFEVLRALRGESGVRICTRGDGRLPGFEKSLGTAVHENGHQHQLELALRSRTGQLHLGEREIEDQMRLFEENIMAYEPAPMGEDTYRHQPLERHAIGHEDAVVKGVMERLRAGGASGLDG